MALLELASAAAGAGIVAIHIRESAIQNGHHLLCFSAAPNQPGQQLHRKIDVLKEQLEAGAQIVQARLTVGRFSFLTQRGKLIPTPQNI